MKNLVLVTIAVLVSFFGYSQTWEYLNSVDNSGNGGGVDAFVKVNNDWFAIGTDANFENTEIIIINDNDGSIVNSVFNSNNLSSISLINSNKLCVTGKLSAPSIGSYIAMYDLNLNMIWEDILNIPYMFTDCVGIDSLVYVYGKDHSGTSNYLKSALFTYTKNGQLMDSLTKIATDHVIFGQISSKEKNIYFKSGGFSLDRSLAISYNTSNGNLDSVLLDSVLNTISLKYDKGNFYTTGIEEVNIDTAFGRVSKHDSLGNLIWSKTFTGDNIVCYDLIQNQIPSYKRTSIGHSLAIKNDKILIIGAVDQHINTYGDLFIGLIDVDGNWIFKKEIQSNYGLYFGTDCEIFEDGSLGVSAYFEDTMNVGYHYLIKLDSVGNYIKSDLQLIKSEIGYNNSIAKVFPTLVYSSINLDLYNNGDYNFQLLNVGGEIVHSEKLIGDAKINLTSLETGIYLYKISSAEGAQTGKLIKK